MSERIPNGFWPQIDHQLSRIATEKPDTFDAVKAILCDPKYTAVVSSENCGPDRAFFAGSGGDATLLAALTTAGWRIQMSEASYYYAVKHPDTDEVISYIEGDVDRGNTLIS